MLAGCAGGPVPMRAVAGTTMALAIGPDGIDGTFGYGSSSFEDSQRGVLGVEFKRGTQIESTVPVKLVTRVMPDPASPAALSGSLALPEPGIPPADILGQVAALIDLPHTLPEGSYDLTIRRYTDDSLTTLIDQGPVENPVWSEVLYIEAGDGNPHPTPFSASWIPGLTYSLQSSHVRQIVPHPQILLTLPPGTAAATLEIEYPDAKIEIKGAYVYRLTGHRALVTVEHVDESTVRVHVVDPGIHGHPVALVFDNTQSGYSPVLKSEFTYVAGAYYGVNGTPITPGGSFDPIGEIR